MEKDTFYFQSPDMGPADVVDIFSQFYGPTMNAFDAAVNSGRVAGTPGAAYGFGHRAEPEQQWGRLHPGHLPPGDRQPLSAPS